MRALFIGGTGTISTAISQKLIRDGWDLTLINRGLHADSVSGARRWTLDIADEQAVREKLNGEKFDVAVDFICFSPEQAQRDIRLFNGITDQFIFISSASAYHKPPVSPVINEGTSLSNPYWQYSRQKAACERVFMEAFESDGFPVTIVRPSHTFCEKTLTVPIHGKYGAYQVLQRMKNGKSVLIPGDGNTLWAVMSSFDFANAFTGLMNNCHAVGEAVQITGEELLTWNQIMRIIADAADAEYRPCYVPTDILVQCERYDFEGALLGDKSNTVIFDNSKLHKLVPGYHETERFNISGKRSVRFMLEHPEYYTPDPEFDMFCDRIEDVMRETRERIIHL